MRLRVKVTGSSTAIAAKYRPAVEKAVQAFLPRLTAFAVDRISTMADSALHRTADAYKRGLVQPDSEKVGETAVISLEGALPQALEQGFDAFDIKAVALSKAKNFSKDGSPYADVPFRWGVGDSSSFQSMPEDVRKNVRNTVRRQQSQMRKAGASATEVATARVRIAQKTPGAEFTRKLKFGDKKVSTVVQHKRGLTDDMVRTAVMGAKKAIGQYNTIRRISANSAAGSWWHPGFQGVRIFEKVRPEIESVAKAMLKHELSLVGIKVKT